MEGFIPGSEETIIINNDEDMQTFFYMYTSIGDRTIHIRLSLLQANSVVGGDHNEESYMSDNASKECDWNDEEKNSGDELSNYDSENDLDCLKNNDSENDDIQTYSVMSDEILANYFKETDLGSLELKQGQTFDNVDHFRKIVKEYAIQEDFPLKRI